jgi:hypothetical protein
MNKWYYIGLGAAIAGVATIIYLNRKEKALKDKPLTDAEITGIVEQVQVEEAAKYSNALLKDYEIVLPTAVADKRVRELAEKITRDRSKINPKKIKKPLMINEL